MSQNKSVPLAPRTPNPGANATAVLFDQQSIISADLQRSAAHGYQRVRISFFADQAVTFYHKWAGADSTTLRTVNGNGSGITVPASTMFVADELLIPGRNQLSFVTVSAPGVWEIAMEAVFDHNLGIA